MTRQKQRVATNTLRSLECRTTPLEHWSKRKPTVEPRWAKQQTKKLRLQPTKINNFMSGPSLSLTPDARRAIKDGSKVICLLQMCYSRVTKTFLSFAKGVCGQRIQAIDQTHKSINKRQIRMFRQTDVDPSRKSVIRRPWNLNILW